MTGVEVAGLILAGAAMAQTGAMAGIDVGAGGQFSVKLPEPLNMVEDRQSLLYYEQGEPKELPCMFQPESKRRYELHYMRYGTFPGKGRFHKVAASVSVEWNQGYMVAAPGTVKNGMSIAGTPVFPTGDPNGQVKALRNLRMDTIDGYKGKPWYDRFNEGGGLKFGFRVHEEDDAGWPWVEVVWETYLNGRKPLSKTHGPDKGAFHIKFPYTQLVSANGKRDNWWQLAAA